MENSISPLSQEVFCKADPDFLWPGAGATSLSADHPGPVRLNDQGYEMQLITIEPPIRGNGDLTPAPQPRQEGPLCGDRHGTWSVIQCANQIMHSPVFRPDLHPEGPLADRGEADRYRKNLGDLSLPSETVDSSCRNNEA